MYVYIVYMLHNDVFNPIFFQRFFFIDYLILRALKIIMMLIMIIPCTCIVSTLLIYLIGCWQSPPLTLVNEMRLLLGPQCLVAMVWVRFISCCLAISRVSWLFSSALSPHTVWSIMRLRLGKGGWQFPSTFYLPPQCSYHVAWCVESRTMKWLWTWDLESRRPGFKFWLRRWLGVSFRYSLRSLFGSQCLHKVGEGC